MSDDRIQGEIGDDSDQAAAGKNINQEKNVGGQAASNVYVYPPNPQPQPQTTRRKIKKAPNVMSAKVEIELRKIIAQAEIRIEDIEATVKRNERVQDNAFEDLRREMQRLRDATRPLDGQGILAAPTQSSTDPEAIKRVEAYNKMILVWVRIVGTTIILAMLTFAIANLVSILWPILSGS